MTIVPTAPVPSPQPASNTFKAIVRSIMPFIYASAASVIAHFGYHVSNTVVIQIVTIGGTVILIVLHAAESKWPAIGILLGYLGAPVYAPSTKVSQTQQIAQLESQIAALVAANEEKSAASPPSAPIPTP